MSLGLSGIAGMYCQNYVNQQEKAVWQSNQADFGKILSQANTKNVGEMQGTEKSNVEAYTDYLRSRFGANVIIQDVGKDQKKIDAIGSSTYGNNNVVIAPNILEKMANDPEKASYYEKKIQEGLDNFPKVQAELTAAGFEIYSYGVGIEADGTVYTYTCGDVSPEKKAKIEAQMKAEDEEKAKRKQRYRELSEEAAEKRGQMAEAVYQRHIAEEALKDRLFITSRNAGAELTEQMVVSAVGAYEAGFVTTGSLM